jgi:hypothetical protein
MLKRYLLIRTVIPAVRKVSALRSPIKEIPMEPQRASEETFLRKLNTIQDDGVDIVCTQFYRTNTPSRTFSAPFDYLNTSRLVVGVLISPRSSTVKT